MNLLLIVITSTLLAGLAMALGAIIAYFEKIDNEWIEEDLRHGVMAFGGGALLSAVALVLVPEGIANLNPLSASLWFVGGGFSFMLLDIFLKKINTPASQLAAMLSDFIPESIALGAAFATGNSNAFLLAALIALQNLPEGFSAYRELNSTSVFKPKKNYTDIFVNGNTWPYCWCIWLPLVIRISRSYLCYHAFCIRRNSLLHISRFSTSSETRKTLGSSNGGCIRFRTWYVWVNGDKITKMFHFFVNNHYFF